MGGGFILSYTRYYLIQGDFSINYCYRMATVYDILLRNSYEICNTTL